MDYNQINNPKPYGLWRILFVVVLFLVLVPLISAPIREWLFGITQGILQWWNSL